jgi:hypothetical protein
MNRAKEVQDFLDAVDLGTACDGRIPLVRGALGTVMALPNCGVTPFCPMFRCFLPGRPRRWVLGLDVTDGANGCLPYRLLQRERGHR